MADSSFHTHTVRVRYAETDQAGMAHHSAFLPWSRFDAVLLVSTVIEKVGGASIRFGYRITRESDASLIAEGYTLHACVDNIGKVKRLPSEVKKMLSH